MGEAWDKTGRIQSPNSEEKKSRIGMGEFGITKHGGFVTKEHNLRVVYAETQLVCDVCTCTWWPKHNCCYLLGYQVHTQIAYVFLEQEHI